MNKTSNNNYYKRLGVEDHQSIAFHVFLVVDEDHLQQYFEFWMNYCAPTDQVFAKSVIINFCTFNLIRIL